MRRVGVVAIVLMGLWVISTAVSLVASLSWIAANVPDLGAPVVLALAASLAAVAAMLWIGVVLIRKRDWIATRLFDDTPFDLSVGPVDLLRVGLILFGASLLASSAIRFPNALEQWVVYASIAGQARDSGVRTNLWVATTGTLVAMVQLGFGLLLVRRSSLVASRLWGSDDGDAGPASPCPVCGELYDPDDYSDMGKALCVRCGSRLDGSA